MAQRKKPKIIYIDESPEEAHADEQAPVREAVAEPVVEPSVRPQAEPRRMRRPSVFLTIAFACIAATVCVAFIFIPVQRPEDKQVAAPPAPPRPKVPNCLGVNPDFDWGHRLEDLTCTKGALEEGQTIGDLMSYRNVDYKQAIQLIQAAQGLEMPPLKPGGTYHFLYPKVDPQHPVIFVYEADPATFIFMNLVGPPAVHMHGREVMHEGRKLRDVVIQTTLAEAMFNSPDGLTLARQMETAIKWKVDLFYLEPGDRFQLLYAETLYEGNMTEVGDLEAVGYKYNGAQAYAFHFQDSATTGWYDSNGRPMKTGFLMAPLEYGRISSGYNLQRPDPFKTGTIRPHLGTDYAAPEGTPILAVADGVVLNAENKGGNGNYVKLQHSDSIQTQYLHMSAFADGVMPGAEVRQGQVIGFVGSTGRSTGPHVCFRYWKNGLQVDHRKDPSYGTGGFASLTGPVLQRFYERRDSLLSMMTTEL